ncbi:MAG: IS1595 family transposase [Actinomycetota bacterium]|nr:IS1595 family transposase [Actinomycetota bacterium]
MSKQEFSIPALANKITTEADAYELLESLRWVDGKPDACPLCGAMERFYYLTPKDGSTGRKTRTGSNSQRRVWKCSSCRKQFSVLTGTIFHGTKISLRTWLFVVLEMCASKNGVSAREIERKYDLTAKSAWFMLHRIREAMKPGTPLGSLLGGAVQVDETWIGGEPRYRHASDPREVARKARPGRDGYSASDKQAVVSLIHYETRQAHSRVVPDVTGATLLSAVEDVMDLKRTHLHTDGYSGYRTVAPHVAKHEYVDHSVGEYTRGNVSTNLAEGYFSQLKRSIDGTHHHVSTEHLDRYLAQFDFMYSHCRDTDTARMKRLLGQVAGRHLSYKPLVG